MLVAFALALPATSAAARFLPPAGHVFAGVTGGSPGSFAAHVGKHPAVFQYFSAWNQPTEYMLAGAAAAHARLMIHISTVSGSREEITPKGIAIGRSEEH